VAVVDRFARTRFAPAPTGFLHLGHVVNALHVWGLGGAHGARVLLRIEDHDAQRARPEYERAILDDLDWLGFLPDEYPTSAFRAGRCGSRQSERGQIYEAAAMELNARGLVYGCDCSRQTIAMAAAAPLGELVYPGTCRDRRLPLGDGLAWRVRIEPGVESFDDLLCGPQHQSPADQCGDLIIRDRLGNWTYQFVAAVDDFRQAIDLVIRGRDLLASTGRQMRLARLLGRTRPATFAHHPLIMKSPTQKLSKSDRDTGVRDLREAGRSAARLIGEAAGAAGLLPGIRDVSAREAPELFRRPPASSGS
jgi:glutamyl-tRNA synthetase/glutamyl-Q tRNA(Asp) synthetase